MTKLLEKALAAVRQLPPDSQDEIARAMLALAGNGDKSTLTGADSVVADRQVFRVNAEQWTAFLAALDAPPKARPRLARLLNEPSLLD